MASFTGVFILECKKDLIEKKQELLNSLRESRFELTINLQEKGGDEMDQTSRILQEKSSYTKQERILTLLSEIESALFRIDRGIFGICEETQEPIEMARLKLIPWTRFSIEGAEIREKISENAAPA